MTEIDIKIGCVVMAAGLSSRFGSNKLLTEFEGKSLAERTLNSVPADRLDRVVVVTRFPEIQAMAEACGFEVRWNNRPEDGISLTIRLGLAALSEVSGVGGAWFPVTGISENTKYTASLRACPAIPCNMAHNSGDCGSEAAMTGEGLTSSKACMAGKAGGSGRMDAVLFMVCDQPELSCGSVSAMLDFYRANPAHIVSMSYNGNRGNPCVFPAVYFTELMALTGDTGGSAVIRKHEADLLLFEAGKETELQDVDYSGDCGSSPQ